MTSMHGDPSGSYRLRVTVGYHDAGKVAKSDRREATFEADSLDDAIAEADGWLHIYNEAYGGNWHSMDDIGLYDMAGDGLLATLGGPDGDDWEIVSRDPGLSKGERTRIENDLIGRSVSMAESLTRFVGLVSRGHYGDAAALIAWLPEDMRTMQSDLRKLTEG